MKTGTLLAIIVFGLVAIAHVLRLVMGWAVTIDAWSVPMWVSAHGSLVPVSISFLLWKDSH